jgi:GT2 family glycosyltransferase
VPPVRVAVVIVNYRTKDLTSTAIRSVLDEPEVEEVVVVDNGSGDDSGPALRTQFSDSPVRLVESPTNIGFGQGVNLGVKACRAPFLLLLNSDAVVRPGSVGLLARALATDESVGVVAPAVYVADGRTLQGDVFGPLPKPRAMLRRLRSPSRDTRFPGWVSGVAMLLRRTDFMAIGGFDPDFTVYMEDVDLCRRLVLAGKRVSREPAASVVHLGGMSSASRQDRFDQFHRSKLIYLQKAGASDFHLWCARVLGTLRHGWERARP